MDNLIQRLHHQLIVSCQASVGEPLDDPAIMAAMAQSAVIGGAAAIRANGPANIQAIQQAVDVPVIGLYKVDYPDSPVYITPTMEEVKQVVAAGCDILAVQATTQPRPNNESLESFFMQLKAAYRLPIMADVSTLEEGITAARLGADLVGTTMAGYTPYSRQLDGPDLQLARDLVKHVDVPVIVEGRIHTPGQVRQALATGAFAVVIGSMITRPAYITAYFSTGLT
jgi:N-acylglucosamine-6-phosphate 2-epimerase